MILRLFDDRVPVALALSALAVAMVAAPGFAVGRAGMAVLRLRAIWAFAFAGMLAATVGLALVPGMPLNFELVGMGAVAGIVAGAVERGTAG